MFGMAFVLLHVSGCSRLLILFTSCLYIRGCVDNSAHLLIAVPAFAILGGKFIIRIAILKFLSDV